MKTFLIILIIILAITVLLLLRLQVFVTFNTELQAEVKYLFIRKYIYPTYKKFKEKDENGKTVTVIRKVKKKSVITKSLEFYISQLKFKFSDNINFIKKALIMIFDELVWVLKRIKIKRLDATINVAKGEAAKTALAYGNINAGVFSLLALIKTYIEVDDDNVLVKADFLGESNSYKVDVIITAPLITAIVFIISLVIKDKKLYNELKSIKEKYQ